MLSWTIDIFFALDIIITFNTAIQDEKGRVIDDLCGIAKDYISGWFFIDFISVFPMDLILEKASGGAN